MADSNQPNSNGGILPSGPDGAPDSHHTQSPTAISFSPSESPTLNWNGGAGSGFTGNGRGNTLGGQPGVGPLPSSGIGCAKRTLIPNVTVPVGHDNRTLVLCFDGTGDQFDSDNSNIVELFSILKKDDPEKQLVYYQAGIGTYTTPQIATPVMAGISKAFDEAVAWNLDTHIMGGYEFLMQNYKAGDKICIFGFSRGAYTANCLAGMIHKVGLLPACNHQQVPFAYKMYTRADQTGWKQSNAFKAAFSTHVNIEFLGVWDTVNSVGIIPRRLPFTTSNTVVRVFRHAVSLDERRAKFKQNTWNRPNSDELQLADSDRVHTGTGLNPRHHAAHHNRNEDSPKKKKNLKQLEREYSEVLAEPTNVEEVWFSGCHCDIGGGSVSNGTRPNLARIPLRWMIRQTFLTNTGIMFSARGLGRIGLDLDANTYHPILQRPPPLEVPSTTFLRHIPRSGRLTEEQHEALVAEAALAEADLSEQEIELRDALSPVYDQLTLSWPWWLLEFLPLRHRYQKEDNSWTWWLGWNLGRGRHIPRQTRHGVKVHRSVKMRLDASYEDGKKYFPRANMRLDKVTWVD